MYSLVKRDEGPYVCCYKYANHANARENSGQISNVITLTVRERVGETAQEVVAHATERRAHVLR